MATHIEIYADIWCPFAHVGLRAARRERERLARADVVFVIRPWPLELVNGRALDPEVTARHVRELREQVAPELFSDFDVDTFPATTLPALSLALAAVEQDPATGESVNWALRDALFEEGRDISDVAVLEDISHRFGVDPDWGLDTSSVELEWRRGQERGVQGSPHFMCADRDAFCPALDISRNETGDLSLHANVDGLHAFLDACLGGDER